MTKVAAVTRTALVTLVLGFIVIHFDQMNNDEPSHFTCNAGTYIIRARPGPELTGLNRAQQVYPPCVRYAVMPQLVNVSLVL